MNYWLAPNGHVYETEKCGYHYELAEIIIVDKYKNIPDKNGILPPHFDAVEFLEKMGYIRYVDWVDRPRWIIYHQKPTHYQIWKMFILTGFIYIK